jgi:hypothetical protein
VKVAKSTIQKYIHEVRELGTPSRRGQPSCGTMLVKSGPAISSRRTISSSGRCFCSLSSRWARDAWYTSV